MFGKWYLISDTCLDDISKMVIFNSPAKAMVHNFPMLKSFHENGGDEAAFAPQHHTEIIPTIFVIHVHCVHMVLTFSLGRHFSFAKTQTSPVSQLNFMHILLV